jgi:outer membrane protein assembly factor BamE (lipoprotein component of BamABCDE complex)
MKTQSIVALGVALVTVLAMAGCMIGPSDTAFPPLDYATTPNGTYPNRDNLRMVAQGETKSQVVDLIGPPHFQEGVFHVRVWNYLFHFAGSPMTCQYQIVFDSDGKVVKTAWKDTACEEVAAGNAHDVASHE